MGQHEPSPAVFSRCLAAQTSGYPSKAYEFPAERDSARAAVTPDTITQRVHTREANVP